MTVTASDEDYDRLCDIADCISGDVWAALEGQDLTCAMIVIGTLLANVEHALAAHGWDRERILTEVCETADACEPELAGRA